MPPTSSKGWSLSSLVVSHQATMRLERIHLNYRLPQSPRIQHICVRKMPRNSYIWGAGTKKTTTKFCIVNNELLLTCWLDNVLGQTRVDSGLTFSSCLHSPQLAETLPNRWFEDHFHRHAIILIYSQGWCPQSHKLVDYPTELYRNAM